MNAVRVTRERYEQLWDEHGNYCAALRDVEAMTDLLLEGVVDRLQVPDSVGAVLRGMRMRVLEALGDLKAPNASDAHVRDS